MTGAALALCHRLDCRKYPARRMTAGTQSLAGHAQRVFRYQRRHAKRNDVPPGMA